jgi:hypothetical protein
MVHPNDQVVSLVKAANPAQAHIWESALRREGIRCQVVGDYLDAGIGDSTAGNLVEASRYGPSAGRLAALPPIGSRTRRQRDRKREWA